MKKTLLYRLNVEAFWPNSFWCVVLNYGSDRALQWEVNS